MTVVHWVLSLLVVWFIGKTLWDFKASPKASPPAPVARSAPAVASDAPAAPSSIQVVKPPSSSARFMDITLEFDGIKSLRGYSAWALDGSKNPNVNKSIAGSNLQVRQVQYKQGVGTHAPSEIVFGLKGKVKRFACLVAPDDSGGSSDHIIFQVSGDGKKLYESPEMRMVAEPLPVNLDVSGVQELSLQVNPAVKGAGWGHADWLNIKFVK